MSVLVVVVVAAVVGIVGAALAESPAGVGRSAAGCRPQTGYGPKVGKVLEVKGVVFQGASEVKNETALLANATLCAARGRGAGTLKFEIEQVKKAQCEMRPGARLRLFPKDNTGVVIRFEARRTYCATSGEMKSVRYGVKKALKLVMDDPLFGVGVGAKGSVVMVKLGFVSVVGRGGRTVVVGAGQQATVPPSGVPQEVVPIRETAEDKKAFGELKGAVPKPDLGRPDAGASSTLKRVFAKGELRIGHLFLFDEGTAPFTDELFGFLAKSWRVASAFELHDSAALAQLLRARQLDLVVTNDEAGLKTFDAFPLFADSEGSTWYVALNRDRVFSDALRNFVRAAVGGGQYAEFYREAFGQEPPLEVLQPVLMGA